MRGTSPRLRLKRSIWSGYIWVYAPSPRLRVRLSIVGVSKSERVFGFNKKITFNISNGYYFLTAIFFNFISILYIFNILTFIFSQYLFRFPSISFTFSISLIHSKMDSNTTPSSRRNKTRSRGSGTPQQESNIGFGQFSQQPPPYDHLTGDVLKATKRGTKRLRDFHFAAWSPYRRRFRGYKKKERENENKIWLVVIL